MESALCMNDCITAYMCVCLCVCVCVCVCACAHVCVLRDIPIMIFVLHQARDMYYCVMSQSTDGLCHTSVTNVYQATVPVRCVVR